MTTETFSIGLNNIRGTDSNSLLRLYDRAREVVASSVLQQQRARAEKTLERIAKELRKRNITH